MTEVNVHDFNHEVDCIYKENKYSVRDNGAILRHSRIGKHPRPLDNIWTFGKPSIKKGYMFFASKYPVHRIVATAFHGESPTNDHVVDHIDTNRRNNRPENLRWLTKLENILLNPITVKRIIYRCGSIEAFLDDPSILGESNLDPNFDWMRTVTKEEAAACKVRMLSWAQRDKRTWGDSLDEWVFNLPRNRQSDTITKSLEKETPQTTDALIESMSLFDPSVYTKGTVEALFKRYEDNLDDLMPAKTPGAAQRQWRTPTEFPCCPQDITSDPIHSYAEKLATGHIFSRNQFSSALVMDSAVIDEGKSILVLNESQEKEAIKPWTIAKITFEDGLYIHEGLGSFFEKEGAAKQFCLKQGLEWSGDNTLTIDELCG